MGDRKLWLEQEPEPEHRKQEKRIAKKMGGRKQPRSGGITGHRGDVKSKQFLVETKTTSKKSYSLTTKVLTKISEEAFGQNRDPLVVVQFEKGHESGMVEEWVVLPATIFWGLLK